MLICQHRLAPYRAVSRAIGNGGYLVGVTIQNLIVCYQEAAGRSYNTDQIKSEDEGKR